jgi:hypothetical protein
MDTLLSIIRWSKDNVLFADDYLSRNPVVPSEAAISGGEATA